MKRDWKKFLCLTHFDCPVPAAVKAGEGYDPNRFAQMVKDSGVDAVYIYARDAAGYSYYPTDVGYRHPNLTCDMFGLSLEALHRKGIGVNSYFCGAFNGYEARMHPEWRFTRADGSHSDQGEFGVVCLYGPYLEESLLPQARELVSRYDIDTFFADTMDCMGPCYCVDCERKFIERTGCKLPRSEKEPGWEKFGEFKAELRHHYARRLCETVHAIKPKLPVAINWVYSAFFFPFSPPQGLSYLTADIAAGSSITSFSVLSRHWSGLGKRFEVMTGRGIHALTNPTIRPLDQLKRDLSLSAYLGGRCLVIDIQRPDGTIDAATHKSLRSVYDFLHDHFPETLESKAVPDIALLHGARTFLGKHLERVGEMENLTRLGAVEGAHRCLLERARHFSILNEEGFTKEMNDYRVVILPEQKFFPAEIAQALSQYVDKGGTLIATHPCGGPEHRAIIEKIFGLKYIGELDSEFAYIDWGDELAHALRGIHKGREKWCESPELVQLQVRSSGGMEDISAGEKKDVPLDVSHSGIYEVTDAKVLAHLMSPGANWKKNFPWMEPFFGVDDVGPAVTVRTSGKGKAIFVAAPIFGMHFNYHDPAIADLTEVLLDLAAKPAPVRVEAPPQVALSLMERPGALDIHLVNVSGESVLWRWHKVVGMSSMAEMIPHIGNILVRIRMKRNPEKVFAIPGEKRIAWRRKGEEIVIPVRDFHIHTCIRIVR